MRNRTPVTLRVTFLLALASILLLFALPPSSRYMERLRLDTLPQMREPDHARRLNEGLSLAEWTRNWVPLSVVSPHARFSKEPGALKANRALLDLGRRWFQLASLYTGWLVMLVVSLFAYVIARMTAPRLSSAPLPLLAAFGLLFLLTFPLSWGLPPLELLVDMRVSAGLLMGQAWKFPLWVFVAALIASFLPASYEEPPPSQFPRFMALLRDASFLSLALISLAFYLTCLKAQALEQRIMAEEPTRAAHPARPFSESGG